MFISEIPQWGRIILLLTSAGAALLLALLIAIFALERLVYKPLQNLQNGLTRIGQGDLDYRVNVAGAANIRRLAAAFNQMGNRLRKRDNKLRTKTAAVAAELAECKRSGQKLRQACDRLDQQNLLLVQILGVGHLLQRNLNPGSLFQEIVQAIHYALGFGRVVLSLVDEDGQRLRTRAYVGLGHEGQQLLKEDASAWEDFAVLLQDRFRIGRCYFFPQDAFNYAVDQQAPDKERAAGGLNGGDPVKAWHPDDALLVLVGLRPGQIEGILSLGQPRDGRRPDAGTLQALEVFASQAAAAIENARLHDQVQQDLVERKQAAEALRRLNEDLEDRVRERIAELARLNETLQAEILERQRIETQITTSLKEKEVLLQEIHHRVKNNLQVISSLLNLQAGYVEDREVREIFKESQNRVRSMALVHEKLYRSDDLARIDLAEYIRNLATFLFRSYSASAGRVTLDIQAEDILLGIDAAVPCGLVLNELISNALKHAFPNDRIGQIRVTLEQRGNQDLTLIVSDNGVGFPPEFDFERSNSLGMQLVHTLVQQLGGRLEVAGNEGSEFEITFSAPSRDQQPEENLVS